MSASQAERRGFDSRPSLGLTMRYFSRRIFWCMFFIFSSIVISGCARIQTLPSEEILAERKGVYHKVHPGQTIWKIAKAYNVKIDDIIQSNGIPNVAKIEENQLIFIPGAESVKEIAPEKELPASEFVWPLEGQILSYFGSQGGVKFNSGIDILSKEGERVSAARAGKVVFADYLNGYAYTVILDHTDGYFTVYAQNSMLLVKVGDNVGKKTPIAKVGRQGQLAFLHFEVRKNGEADNPLYYLP